MPEGHLPFTSHLAVPVISREGEVIGGLFFGHSAAARFTARHEEIIVGLAAQAAIAVEHSRLISGAQEANETLELRVLERTDEPNQAHEGHHQAQKERKAERKGMEVYVA